MSEISIETEAGKIVAVMVPYDDGKIAKIRVVPRGDFDDAIRLLRKVYDVESGICDGTTSDIFDKIAAFIAKHGEKQ